MRQFIDKLKSILNNYRKRVALFDHMNQQQTYGILKHTNYQRIQVEGLSNYEFRVGFIDIRTLFDPDGISG
jgi:hypothetical protein